MIASAGGPTGGLAVRGVTKSYGANVALDDITVALGAQRVTALAGGNGSGKSTLIKVLAGVVAADAGELTIDGHRLDLVHHDPGRARAAGLRFVHQDLGVFGSLSIAENIALGTGWTTRRFGRIDWRAQRARAAEAIERFSIDATPDTRLAALRPAEQTLVAIARAVADAGRDATIVLDEPTASLPRAEVALLFDAIASLAATSRGVVLVTHRLDEIIEIADDLVVLRDGRLVASGPVEGLDLDDLVTAITGNAPSPTSPATGGIAAGTPLLRVRDLHVGPVRGATFDVAHGEVVGVAGLLGSGRTELLEAIFGVRRFEAGSIEVDGRPHRPATVADAIASGIALVPEQRIADALFVGHSVRHNLSATVVSQYWRRWRLSHHDEASDAAALVQDFAVTPGDESLPIGALSGGNQQKVVMARWLRRRPRVLLLDEPTQGVDIGARAALHGHAHAAAATGAAVLYVSSDFEELVTVCTRVLVLAGGRVVADLSGPQITVEALVSRCFDSRKELV